MNSQATDTSKFWKDGYLIIKSVFTPEEIEFFRSEISKRDDSAAGDQSKGDILSNSNPELSKVIYDDRILTIAKEILGGVPVYFGDSTISVGSHHRGWHKDNRLPDRFQHHLADWSSQYSLIRFGVYLQDHKRHSGGLAVRKGSHNRSRLVNRVNKLKIPFMDEIKGRRVVTRMAIWASNLYGRAKILDVEVGDLVVWNQRTTHSGNALRAKLLPWLKMPTWLENKIPEGLIKKYHKDRMAFFMTYGLDDAHLSRAIDFLKKRKYMVNSWAVSTISDTTLGKIDSDALQVKQPPEIADDCVPPHP